MDQTDRLEMHWTEQTKLDLMSLSGLYGRNGPNWTEVDQMEQIEPNYI